MQRFPPSLELTMTLNTSASGASITFRVLHSPFKTLQIQACRNPSVCLIDTANGIYLNKVLSNGSNPAGPWRQQSISMRNWECPTGVTLMLFWANCMDFVYVKGHSRKYWSLRSLLLPFSLIFLNYERAVIDKRSRWILHQTCLISNIYYTIRVLNAAASV